MSFDLSELSQRTLELMKDVTTNGITSGTNLNYYQLEPQAKNLYPVMYPFLASTPRHTPTEGAGTQVNWKGIVQIDSGGTLGIEEGKRNAFMNFTERDFSAPYSFFGKDGDTTFVAEATGRGFDDNLALNQLSLLNAFLNDEERMLLLGNRSAVTLGTTPTPTVALAAGGTIPTATSVTVGCVALTAMGAVKGVNATSISTSASRTNADGSTTTVSYGSGKASALSTAVTTTSGNQSVTATVTGYPAGAVAFAWYVSSTGTAATAYFSAVTNVPSITITSLPSSSNQALSAVTADNSQNATDCDGLLSLTFGQVGNSYPSYFKDLAGGGFTANGDSSIKEIDDALAFFWTNYKTVPDVIRLGGTLIDSFTKAMLQGTNPSTRLNFDRNASGELTGATIAKAYLSRYSYNGQPKVITVETHPWIPQGVVLFDTIANPYVSAGNVIPVARRVNCLLDHFSIQWPITTLSYEIGVYAFETLQNYLPQAFGAIVNVKP